MVDRRAGERKRMKRKRKRGNKSRRDTKAATDRTPLPLESARKKADLACSFLIPGLPSDVALAILVRLPNVVQARLRLVCRAWKDAMEPTVMSSIRKMLHISEVWLVSTSRFRKSLFTVVDPLLCRNRRIYRPPKLQSHGSSLEFIFFGIIGHEVLIAVKPKPVAPVKALELQGLYSFDGARMKWNDAKYSSLPNGTHLCATDVDGGYLYVMGVYCVERLDLKTKMWEILPDPHVKRRGFGGVMLQSRFCLLQGVDAHNAICNSGEIWDPASQEWTLVPELWPFEVFGNHSPISRVVVVMDQLYALKTFAGSVELIYFETSFKLWISLGYLPISNDGRCRVTFGPNDWVLFGIDQELWAFDQLNWTFLVSKPSLSQPLSWRILPISHKVDLLTKYMGAMLV